MANILQKPVGEVAKQAAQAGGNNVAIAAVLATGAVVAWGIYALYRNGGKLDLRGPGGMEGKLEVNLPPKA